MANIKLSNEQENYLLKIYEFQESFGIVKLRDLKNVMHFSFGAINDEIVRLEKFGFVKKIPYRGIKLTEKGLDISRKITKKHRLAELFLFKFLDVPWEKCHELSDDFEHSIKGDLEKYIIKKLGNEKYCPHGNPIDGAIKNEIPLEKVKVDQEYRILRITYEEENILSILKAMGIMPDKKIRIKKKSNGTVLFETETGQFTLTGKMLRIIRVKHE